MEALPEESQQLFLLLIREAKQFANEGKLHESIKKFKEADNVFPTEKVKKRIVKIQVGVVLNMV